MNLMLTAAIQGSAARYMRGTGRYQEEFEMLSQASDKLNEMDDNALPKGLSFEIKNKLVEALQFFDFMRSLLYYSEDGSDTDVADESTIEIERMVLDLCLSQTHLKSYLAIPTARRLKQRFTLDQIMDAVIRSTADRLFEFREQTK